jgi:molybdenum cofactor cytidylyltransferase
MPKENEQTVRVFAIVPAAGRSRRMGTPKQLLDVGGRTMLAAVLDPLIAAGVHGVVLVTQTALADRIDLSAFPRTTLAINEDPNSQMIDSVRIGLVAWRQREPIGERDGVLVCPADQPGIAAADFAACINAFRNAPDRIVIAAHKGQRGHPIIFPASLIPFVQSNACDAGLNALPKAHADRMVLVECGLAVTRDVDTRVEYDRLGD